MKFEVAVTQEVVGYRISVRVVAEGSEELDAVTIKHNGSTLLSEDLPGPGHTSFSSSVGGGGVSPGMHRVLVTARITGGRDFHHTHAWSDQA